MRPPAEERATLTSAVFPRAAAGPLWSWPALATAATLVAGVALIQLLRLPRHAAVNTVWAEDGPVFLQGAKLDGGAAILHAYNGYVHLVPRLLAALVAVLPVSWAALALGLLSSLVVGVVALVVFVASRAHIPSPWWRVGLCAAIALMPVAGTEMLANLANLHWYLMLAAFWALLWRPAGVAPRLVQFAVCLLAAGSDPLCVLLLPIAIARVVASRSAADHAPTAGLVAGLAIQLIARAGADTVVASAVGHAGPLLLGRLYALRVLLPATVGDRGARSLFLHVGWWPAYLAAALVVVVAGIWATRNLRRGAWWLLAAFGVTSVLMFVVPVELRWDPAFTPNTGVPATLSNASRYTMLPLFMIWCLVALALGGRWPARGRGRRAAVVLTVAAAAAITVVDFSATQSPRLDGPAWKPALAEARSACLATPGLRVAPVRISPAGWLVDLPCADIIGH